MIADNLDKPVAITAKVNQMIALGSRIDRNRQYMDVDRSAIAKTPATACSS